MRTIEAATENTATITQLMPEGVELVESICHGCENTIRDLTLRVFCNPCLGI